MINFKPLEKTLEQRGTTVYDLINQGVITYVDWNRMKKNHNYTLKFIDKLCSQLNCKVEDLIGFEEDNTVNE